MKASQFYLSEIERLRAEHTELFNAHVSMQPNKWIKMATIQRKIRDSWAAYHKAVERENRNN